MQLVQDTDMIFTDQLLKRILNFVTVVWYHDAFYELNLFAQ